VTGAGGFIGYHLCQRLLALGFEVVGVDILTDYYDPKLKQARLAMLASPRFSFHMIDIADKAALLELFSRERPSYVFNLAAQAGVRYSLTNAAAYIHSNVSGFLGVLEACRAYPVEHLVFASTSSVYGATAALLCQEPRGTEHPLTLYAATKKANEVMAHSYAHLFGIPSTGVRFFTVYGPWGRPDMALYIFTEAMLAGRPIPLFNGGAMHRDFTYVDDIVHGLIALMPLPPSRDQNWDPSEPDPSRSGVAPYRILNIGRGKTEPLSRYVALIEEALGVKALVDILPMQPGDVQATSADTSELTRLTGFSPSVDIDVGVRKFLDWYLDYHGHGHR
jgi:UDP-glucuronate 4-epimerase